jgi:hypothetical protein
MQIVMVTAEWRLRIAGLQVWIGQSRTPANPQSQIRNQPIVNPQSAVDHGSVP